MLEIGLGGCFAALLQLVEVIFNLFGVQLGRQALKVQGQGSHMAAVIVEGAGASAQNGNIALKALQQFGKSLNFTACPMEIAIPSQFFQRFFFVVII